MSVLEKTPVAAPVVATTAQGAVQGLIEKRVSVFRGIPYALPPVGRLRFRPPVRVAGWEGMRDATRFGAICPQPGGSPIDEMGLRRGVPQGDDCLNLNVWTPSLEGAAPVLVWIHGGSFKWGAGSVVSYDGTAFARRGVVVVTLNYRLGALGFLNVGDRPGTGFFGILDQIAALEWVQENIAAFGGDPDLVTIAGESAGGFSVGQLLAAPAAKGLFRRAISQSGGAQLHMPARSSAAIGERLLDRLGARPDQQGDLEALSTQALLAAQVLLEPEIPSLLEPLGAPDALGRALAAFTPTYGASDQPIHALDAIRGGSAKEVDVMVGWNTDEMVIAYPSPETAMLGQPFIERGLDAAFGASGLSGRTILQGYADRRGMNDLAAIVEPAATDFIFRMPSIRLAEAALAAGSRTFMYRFDWRAGMGAVHGLDIGFMWDTLEASRGLLDAFQAGEAPQTLADTMNTAWSTFVQSGTPRDAALPAWPLYAPERRATMNLDVVSTVIEDPGAEEREIWEAARY